MWLLSLAVAALGAPVSLDLPAGEPVAGWQEALDVADLEPTPGATATVRIFRDGGGWTLEVTRPGAPPHRTAIDPPITPAARERAALLAASLLVPTRVDELAIALPPPVPAPVPRPRTPPRPSPSPAPAPEPAPEPAIVAAPVEEAAPIAPAEEAPAIAPEPSDLPVIVDLDPAPDLPAPRPTIWWSVRAGLCAHPGQPVVAPTVGGWGGLAIRPWLRIGGGLAIVAPMALDLNGVVGGDRAILDTGVRGGAWLGDRVRIGVIGAAARRSFLDRGEVVQAVTVPTLGGEAALTLPLRAARITPVVGVHRDLRPVQLFVGAEPVGRLVPTTFEVAIDLQLTRDRT